MNTPWYDYLPDSSGNIFYFASLRDAKINKVIVFTDMDDPNAYSIALGNLQNDGSIDLDGTMEKEDTSGILSTVAKAIAFFLADHPEAEVFIEGTTPARARLYQMAIVRELDDLGRYFDIYGFDGSKKEPLQSGKNYLSFSVSLKSS